MKPQGTSSTEIDLVGACTEAPIPVEIAAAVEKKISWFKSSKRNAELEIAYTPSYLSWCQRLQYYIKKAYPRETLDSELDDPFASGFSLFRGDALHAAFGRIYRWSELPLKQRFKINTKDVLISGRLDLYQPDRKEILDLKTTKFLGWQKKSNFIPRLKDIRQLQIYQVLYGDWAKIIPVEKLTLIYMDMKDLISFDIPVMAEAKQWLKDRIQLIENSLDDDIPPSGETNKLCDYCPMQSRCAKDPGGITTKPKSKLVVLP